MGRFDESVAEAKRSLELDPFSEFTKDFAEWAFYLSRRYELTIQQSERSFELAPEFPWAQYDLGQAYELTGRSNEAIEAFIKADEIFGMTPERLAEVRKAFRESGAKGYWRKTLSFCLEASRHPRKFASKSGCGYCDYAQHADVAAMQLRVGELDAVFAWLEKAYTSHDATLMYLNADPRWDPIRSDPRFADLVRRIGLPQVQSTSKPSESKRGM
jgi:tetratricopeptide (TPR) repeat protein